MIPARNTCSNCRAKKIVEWNATHDMINCVHTDDLVRIRSVVTGSFPSVLDARNDASQGRPVTTVAHNAP